MTKLPTPAKLGLLGAGVLLALVIGWFAVIGPKRSDASELAKQIEDTRAQIELARAASRPQSLTPAIRVADLFDLTRAMPNRADIPGVVLQLSQVAKETGIDFQSITPQDPAQVGAYQRIGLDLVFQGRFYDLSDFLYRLRNLVAVRDGELSATGRLFSVESISFDEGELQFPQVRARLSVSAYVYGDGTGAAAPVPTAAPAETPTSTSSASESSQPIPAAPPGATASGA
jgi:Tfp pilus assembly protein PilO